MTGSIILGFILFDFLIYPVHFLSCPQYLTFQNQLGLPDHGMPVRAAMMHRIRQHAADCESFDASYFFKKITIIFPFLFRNDVDTRK